MPMQSLSLCAAIILCIAHDSLSFENQTVSNVTKADNNDLKLIVNRSENVSLDKAKATSASHEEKTEAQRNSEEKPHSKDGQQDNKDARGKSGELSIYGYNWQQCNNYTFLLYLSFSLIKPCHRMLINWEELFDCFGKCNGIKIRSE